MFWVLAPVAVLVAVLACVGRRPGPARQTVECATCGGTRFVERQLDRPYTALIGGPCPDCCPRELAPRVSDWADDDGPDGSAA